MEITTRGLSQSMSGLAPPPVAPIPIVVAPALATAAAVPTVSDAGPDSAKIVTTAEELDFFERVKKIVASSPTKMPLIYKDTATYFAVNLGNVRRWFVRFFANGPTKYLILRMPHDALKPLLGATPSTGNGVDTRVNVASGADVDRLSAAILAAYEVEAHRKDADAGAEA